MSTKLFFGGGVSNSVGAPVGATHIRTQFNLQVPGSVQLDYDGIDITSSYDADAGVYGRIYSGTWRLAVRAGDFLRQRGGKGGANVGDQQSDQFQGHWHYGKTHGCVYRDEPYQPVHVPDDTYAGEFGYKIYSGNPAPDGVNGEPRTGDETRPINTAVEFWVRVA